MTRLISRLALTGLVLVLAGCASLPFVGGVNPTRVTIPTRVSIPTLTPVTPPPGTALAPPSSATLPADTQPAPPPAVVTPQVVRPTFTPLSPIQIPTQPPATGGRFTQIKIYLIAIEDNGVSGPLVGCGDSAIAVVRNIAPTNAPLTGALKDLLSLHDRNYGQSGLYNALYQSNLQVSSVVIQNGVAIIRLTGQLSQGGECDSPRIQAQLTRTALQFSTVRSAQIFLNGVPLEQVLSLK